MARELSGEASEADKRELEALMEAHPELKDTLLATASLQADNAMDTELVEMSNSGWEQIKEEVNIVVADRPSRIRRLLKPISWAAAILLLVALSYNSWQNHSWVTLATKEKKDSVTLSDGSVIFLNTHTTLRYARNYGKHSRKIILDKGEAYFDVAPLSDNPFTVYAVGVDINVLGTAFNVHRSPIGTVDVFVSSGRVKASTDRESSLVLAAGEQVSVMKKSAVIKPVATRKDNVLAWRTNTLVFNRMPLSEVAVVLANYYQLDVVVTDSAVAHKELQATFNNKSLDEVLSIIGKALHVNIDQNEKTLEFHQ